MEQEKNYDVLVVGGGFAGTTAAIVAARAGLKVAVFDFTEFMGSKIVLGNLITSSTVQKLIPDFEKSAPLERFIKSHKYICLSEDSSLSVEYEDEKFYTSPYNHLWAINRKKFDPWYLKQAEEAGATIFSAFITDLVYEDSRVVGVKTKEGEIHKGCVTILATGGNSKLIKQMGDHPDYPPDSFILGIKEIKALPPEIIEKRFFLQGKEGVSYQYYGDPLEGNVGSAFLVTNQGSLALGVVINAKSLKGKVRNAPYRFLNKFKEHPRIKRLIKGARCKAISTYIMPEIGADYMRNLVCNGAMIAGDAAGFVNANLYSIGTLMATTSGLYAGETAVSACKKKDFSMKTLGAYTDKIIRSFMMNDMRRYNRTPYFAQNFPDFFKIYPEMAVKLAGDYLSNTGESPGKKQKRIFGKVKEELTLFPFLKELLEPRRRFGRFI